MPEVDPLTEFTRPPSPPVDALISKHATRTGLDPELIQRVIGQESRGRNRAVSPKGAGGLMQLMPGTAQQVRVKNVFDPDENIRGGTDYLKQQLDKFGDVNLALAAYNAGPGAVIKHGNKIPPYAETQNYVKKIAGGYQGTGYAQDPLTTFTQGKSQTVQPASDPLTSFTQPEAQVESQPAPQGRGAAMANVVTTPQPQLPVRQSQQGSSLTANDAAWHFGVTPDEVKLLTPRAMRVLQEAVTEDQRKKSLGQEIQQPSIQYQNEMRKQARLPLIPLARQYYNGTDTENKPLGGNPLITVNRATPIEQANDAALMEQATKNVSALNFDPMANATSLYRMATRGKEAGFEADVQEEFQKLKAQQERANTPEMIAARKRIGAVPESVMVPGMPSPRGVASAFQRFGGETLKATAGAVDASSVITGLGPLANYFGVNPIPKVKDYLNQRGTVLEESASMPMNEQGQAIERSLPEKATDTVTGLGLSLAQLVLLKKATGLNLGPLMALESALKNSDAKATDRIGGAAEAYAMGKILDQHLSRPLSALAFGAPTAVQSGLSVAQGNMKLEDALLQTGVQVAAGAVLGGKQPEAESPTQTVPDELQAKLRGSEIDTALRAREAAVKPVTDAQGNVLLNADEIARDPNAKPKIKLANQPTNEPAHPSNFQPRTEEGKFDGAPEYPEEFRPENIPATEQPAERLNTPLQTSTEVPLQPAIEPSNQAAQPVKTETTATSLVQPDRVAFLKQKLADMGAANATLANTSPERLATINDTRAELARAQIEVAPTSRVSEPQPIETKPSIEGERSFPKTLESTGREGGTDRAYQVVRDQDAIDKADARIKDNPESARQWASDQLDKGSGKEAIATGLRVADNLSNEASKESDPTKAAEKHAQASDLYSKLAARLTESGQEVQAASLAQKYDPSGAALEVQRIVERVKGKGAKPDIQDTQTARDLAGKYQVADARISELEKQIATLQAGKIVSAPRTSSVTPLKAKLDKAAEDAALRIAATKAKMQAGELEFRNAGPLPGHIATHLTDYAIIGASKIAKGGLTFAEWSSEMVKDLGDEIKPHLATIFRASKKHLDEQRATAKEESAQRGATKELTKRGVAPTPENIESLRIEKSKLQAERRQARVDLDRHYRELERKEQGHKLDAVLSLTRDSLLTARGPLKLLIGMGGKQVLDFNARFVKAGLDVARSTITGGPRTVSAPSFASTLRTIGGFAKRAPSAIKSAVQGKPSEVMPNAHGGPTENPYVNLTVGIMQRIYGGKEAFISSWAYPEALENNARVFALNDRADGITKLGQTNQRTRDYLAGKLSFEGKRNQKLAESLANQAANYEVSTKQIVPSMKEFRAKELAASPSELLHSMALQATDRAVYRQPYESKLAQKLGQIGTESAGGKIARNIVLPFSKRPANNIADNLFGYTGVRIFGEGYKAIRESINGEFGPARVKSFNDAIGKGATGFAVMAVGAALAKQGKLISPLDKDKSKAGALFINGKYYNISNVPVIGWLLGMGAAYQKDGAANLPKALYRMISEHPLLRSAKDISDMVEGLKSNKPAEQISEYVGQQASRIIPAPVKIAGEALDTEERQTKFSGKKADIEKNLIAPTEKSLPILRRQLPSRGTKGRLSVINPLYSAPISRRPQGRVIQ